MYVYTVQYKVFVGVGAVVTQNDQALYKNVPCLCLRLIPVITYGTLQLEM